MRTRRDRQNPLAGRDSKDVDGEALTETSSMEYFILSWLKETEDKENEKEVKSRRRRSLPPITVNIQSACLWDAPKQILLNNSPKYSGILSTVRGRISRCNSRQEARVSRPVYNERAPRTANADASCALRLLHTRDAHSCIGAWVKSKEVTINYLNPRMYLVTEVNATRCTDGMMTDVNVNALHLDSRRHWTMQ